MTQSSAAAKRYREVMLDLLHRRKSAGGELPATEEARFAAILDQWWHEMTDDEQAELERELVTLNKNRQSGDVALATTTVGSRNRRRSAPDPFASQIGARVRELRIERNMSLSDLADAAMLSKGHLSSVEHGLAAITINTILGLARGFSVPPLYLLTFAEEDERAHIAELIRRLPTSEVRKLRRQLQAQLGQAVVSGKTPHRTKTD